MAKYDKNVNKNGIFAIKLYFLYLFTVKNYHGTFFNGRIRFLLQSHRLRIDTGARRKNENLLYFNCIRIEQNRIEPLNLKATSPRCCPPSTLLLITVMRVKCPSVYIYIYTISNNIRLIFNNKSN